jgi:hypothetical protein
MLNLVIKPVQVPLQHGIADPADESRIYSTTCGGGLWHGPAVGDPRALEDIVGSTVRRQA